MKRKIQSINDFRASSSQFRGAEQEALNISIREYVDFKSIFKYNYQDIDEDELGDLNKLLLKDYDNSTIIRFKPSDDDQLTTIQRKFLTKLRLILLNNDPEVNAPNCEKFIDELASFLCDVSMLDDGYKLVMRPCNLCLTINDQTFVANADREGRKDNKLVWLIQEDKHIQSKTWLHGDVQLACSMIAAAQYNYIDDYQDQKILGLKFIADEVYFCYSIITKDYLEDLTGGLPINDVMMLKSKPLCLSDPKDRQIIFKLMVCMRKEALDD